MKKSNLIYGLIYSILAGISLYVAIFLTIKCQVYSVKESRGKP